MTFSTGLKRDAYGAPLRVIPDVPGTPTWPGLGHSGVPGGLGRSMTSNVAAQKAPGGAQNLDAR